MRVLLLNQNHIGDALFTTPAIAALREALPDAYIVNAAVAGVKPIFIGNPHLSELRVRPVKRPLDYVRIMVPMRKARFDAVISFSASSTLFGVYARFSGAPIRIGFDHRALRRFVTHPVRLNDNEQHHVLDHLDQVAVLAPVRRDFPIELNVQPEWRERAAQAIGELHLTGDRPMIALNPGATVERKKWPAERWSQLADRLAAAGFQPVLIGGPGDSELAASVQRAAHVVIPSTQGRLSLGALAAAAERCAVFVSADSGPMHVAVAVGTPVVALHGPTSPARTGPYTDRAVVVHHPESDLGEERYGRMETIEVDEVNSAVERAFELGR